MAGKPDAAQQRDAQKFLVERELKQVAEKKQAEAAAAAPSPAAPSPAPAAPAPVATTPAAPKQKKAARPPGPPVTKAVEPVKAPPLEKFELPPDLKRIVDYRQFFDKIPGAVTAGHAVDQTAKEMGLQPHEFRRLAEAQGVNLEGIYDARMKGRSYDEVAQANRERGVLGFMPVNERTAAFKKIAEAAEKAQQGIASDTIEIVQSGADKGVSGAAGGATLGAVMGGLAGGPAGAAAGAAAAGALGARGYLAAGTSTELPEVSKPGEHGYTVAALLVQGLKKDKNAVQLYDLYGRRSETGATQRYIQQRTEELARRANISVSQPDATERMAKIRRQAVNEIIAYKTVGQWTPAVTMQDVEVTEGRVPPGFFGALKPNIELIGFNNKNQAVFRQESPLGVLFRAIDVPQAAIVGKLEGGTAAQGVQTGANFLDYALEETEGSSAFVRAPVVAAGFVASVAFPDVLAAGGVTYKGIRAAARTAKFKIAAPKATELLRVAAEARKAGQYEKAIEAEAELRNLLPVAADSLDRFDAEAARAIKMHDPESDIYNEDLAALIGGGPGDFSQQVAREAESRTWLHPSLRKDILSAKLKKRDIPMTAYSELYNTRRQLERISEAKASYLANAPKSTDAYAEFYARGATRDVLNRAMTRLAKDKEFKFPTISADEVNELADIVAKRAPLALTDEKAFRAALQADLKASPKYGTEYYAPLRQALHTPGESRLPSQLARKLSGVKGKTIDEIKIADMALFDRALRAIEQNNEARGLAAALLRDEIADQAKINVQPVAIFDDVVARGPDGAPVRLSPGGSLFLYKQRQLRPNAKFEDLVQEATAVEAVAKGIARRQKRDLFDVYRDNFDIVRGTREDLVRAGGAPIPPAAPSAPAAPAAPAAAVPAAAAAAAAKTVTPRAASSAAARLANMKPPIPVGTPLVDIASAADARKLFDEALARPTPLVQFSQETADGAGVAKGIIIGDARVIVDEPVRGGPLRIIVRVGDAPVRSRSVPPTSTRAAFEQGIAEAEKLMEARVAKGEPAIRKAPEIKPAAPATPPVVPPAAVTPPTPAAAPTAAAPPKAAAPAPGALPVLADTVEGRKAQLREYLRANPGVQIKPLFRGFQLDSKDVRQIHAEVKAERAAKAAPAAAPVVEAPKVPAPAPTPDVAKLEAEMERLRSERDIALETDDLDEANAIDRQMDTLSRRLAAAKAASAKAPVTLTPAGAMADILRADAAWMEAIRKFGENSEEAAAAFERRQAAFARAEAPTPPTPAIAEPPTPTPITAAAEAPVEAEKIVEAAAEAPVVRVADADIDKAPEVKKAQKPRKVAENKLKIARGKQGDAQAAVDAAKTPAAKKKAAQALTKATEELRAAEAADEAAELEYQAARNVAEKRLAEEAGKQQPLPLGPRTEAPAPAPKAEAPKAEVSADDAAVAKALAENPEYAKTKATLARVEAEYEASEGEARRTAFRAKTALSDKLKLIELRARAALTEVQPSEGLIPVPKPKKLTAGEVRELTGDSSRRSAGMMYGPILALTDGLVSMRALAGDGKPAWATVSFNATKSTAPRIAQALYSALPETYRTGATLLNTTDLNESLVRRFVDNLIELIPDERELNSVIHHNLRDVLDEQRARKAEAPVATPAAPEAAAVLDDAVFEVDPPTQQPVENVKEVATDLIRKIKVEKSYSNATGRRFTRTVMPDGTLRDILVRGPSDRSEPNAWGQFHPVTVTSVPKVRLKAAELDAKKLAQMLDDVAEREAEQALAQIDEQRDFAKAIEDGETVTQGKLEADMTRIIELLGANMYNKPLAEVAVKELIQNSFDAVKAAVASGQIEQGDIVLKLLPDTRSVEVTDNGVGMSAEIVQKAMFTIAGTHKPNLAASQRSGGLGLAKMAFLFGSKEIELTTVKDGIQTYVRTNPAEIRANNFKIVQRKVPGQPNGTTMRVSIPEKYYDVNKGEDVGIYFSDYPQSYSFLARPLIGPTKLTTISGWNEATTKVATIGDDKVKLTGVKFDWGTADIYVGRERPRYPTHSVLSSGLYQFDTPIQKSYSEKFPYDVVIDVKPNVTPEHPHYPFNQQRENFRGTVEADVKALTAYLMNYAKGLDVAETADRFKNAVKMERVGLETVGGDINQAREAILKRFSAEAEATRRGAAAAAPALPENVVIKKGEVKDATTGKVLATESDLRAPERSERKAKASFEAEKKVTGGRELFGSQAVDPKTPLFHNNTNIDYVQAARDAGHDPEAFFTLLGSVVVEFRERAAKLPGYEVLENAYASGVSIDKEYKGVHVRVPYQAFFVNPLAHGGETPVGAAESMMHTLIHEAVHTRVNGHDENFTIELGRLYEKLADSADVQAFRTALEKTLSQHWDTFLFLRGKYDQFTTTNLARSMGSEPGAASSRASELYSKVAGEPSGAAAAGGRERAGVLGAGLAGDAEGAARDASRTGADSTRGVILASIAQGTAPAAGDAKNYARLAQVRIDRLERGFLDRYGPAALDTFVLDESALRGSKVPASSDGLLRPEEAADLRRLYAEREGYLNAANAAPPQPSGIPEAAVRQTETPEFKAWFGDSKVVDAEGKPLVVYHSGLFDAEEDPIPRVGREGFHFGTRQAAEERDAGKRVDDFIKSIEVDEAENEFGEPAWFWRADDIDSYDLDPEGFSSAESAKAAAERFAMNQDFTEMEPMPLTPAFLSIKNPKRVPDQKDNWEPAIRQAKAEGHDGIVYRNEFEDKGSDSYIVFEPTQIKSATANVGTFSPEDPNILRQVSPTGQIKGTVRWMEDGRAVIALFDGADVSTVLHEAAHIVRRNALDAKDMENITTWIRRSGVNVTHEFGEFVGSAADVERAEELFAKAFEQYVMEGVAPTPTLAEVFAHLKRVLVDIYKGVTDPVIGKPVAPEVKAVFDRLLQETEEQSFPSLKQVMRRELLGGPKEDIGFLRKLSEEAQRKGIPRTSVEDLMKQFDTAAAKKVADDKPYISFPVKVLGKQDWTASDLAEAQAELDKSRMTAAARKRGLKLNLAGKRLEQTALIEEDSAVESLRSALTRQSDETGMPAYLRTGMRSVAAAFFGGDVAREKGVRLMPPEMRKALDTSERVIENAIGDTVTLVNDALESGKSDALYRFLSGDPRVTRLGGRPITSGGHDFMESFRTMLRRTLESLPEEQQYALSRLADVLSQPKWTEHLTTIGYEGVDADGHLIPFAKATKEAAKVRDDLGKAIETLLHASGKAEDELGIGLAQAISSAVGAPNVARPPYEFKLVELLTYIAGKTGRGYDEKGAWKMFKGDSRNAVETFLGQAGEIYNEQAKRQLAVIIGGYGSADVAKRTLIKLDLGISEPAKMAFTNWITGEAWPAQYTEEIQRIIDRYGLNADFVADRILGVDYYIPKQARERMANALARVKYRPLEASTGGDAFNTLYRYMKTRMTRGSFFLRQRYFMANTVDHFIQSGMTYGWGIAANSVTRVIAQDLMVLPAWQQALELARKLPGGEQRIPRDVLERARRALQAKGDLFGNRIGQLFGAAKYRIEVNPILEGIDGSFRAGDKVYSFREIRNLAVEEGVFASFDTRQLSNVIQREGALFINTEMMRWKNVIEGEAALEKAGEGRVLRGKIQNFLADWQSTVSDTAEAWGERERLGAMVALMEAGYDPRTAARLTIDALYDYSQSMTKADRSILVGIMFPFWAFQKNANVQVFNNLFSPWGAYRMMCIRRARERSADLLTEVLYGAVGDEFGMDVESMPPNLQDSYYSIVTEFYNQYNGDPPEDAKHALRMLLLGRGRDVEGGRLYELSPELLRMREAGLFSDIQRLSRYAQAKPSKVSRVSYLRERAGFAVPFPKTEAVQVYQSLLGDDHSFMEMFWPESSIETGLRHITQMAATLIVASSQAPDLLSGGALTEGGAREVKVMRVIEPVFDPERSPILAPLLADMSTDAMPPKKLASGVSAAAEATQLAATVVHPLIGKMIDDMYGTTFLRVPADVDPFIVDETGQNLKQLPPEEIERIRKLQAEYPDAGVLRDQRYYVRGGVWSMAFENTPLLGELNALLLRYEREPMERTNLRGQILRVCRAALGIDVSMTSPQRTVKYEEPTKLRETKGM